MLGYFTVIYLALADITRSKLPPSPRLLRGSQPPSWKTTSPTPGPGSPPPVIEAVAIGRGLVDEASAHIIGNAIGDGCTLGSQGGCGSSGGAVMKAAAVGQGQGDASWYSNR